MTYIAAIAAPIGGGKTTFTRAVAEALGDAQTIHFDRYEKLTQEPVHFLKKWVAQGADFNRFHVPELPALLERLKAGETVIDPADQSQRRPSRYVVFEMPLGKEHRETAQFIDLLIWIEIPLDIALARKIREFTALMMQQQGENIRNSLIWMDGYLENYLQVIRDVLQIQRQRIRPTADIIIDGTTSPETTVRAVAESIQSQCH